MGEAYLNTLAGGIFQAESAGLEPGMLNPYVVDVMKEIGIDLSGKQTKNVYEFLRQGRSYDYVITVCDESSGSRCPFFPGKSVRLHWTFDDPAGFECSEEEIRAQTRRVRDQIATRIKAFISESSA
jgi:arsenate reductase